MSRLFLGFAALALVSACGIKSGLDRPDPLWNSQEAIAHECARERQYNTEHASHPQPLDRRCGAPAQSDAPPTLPPPQSPTAPR